MSILLTILTIIYAGTMNELKKQANQDSVKEEIKFFAWHQVATGGVGSISLGGIARSMNITTPALYRYFDSRDHLILALTLDAYNSFYAALVAARDSVAVDDHAGRFHAISLAYFFWALDHQQQYQVIFGFSLSPYELDETVGQIADKCFLIVIEMMAQACEAGRIASAESLEISTELANRLERLTHEGKSWPAHVMYLVLASWSFINGITSLEIDFE
ncbi:TetR/AcrR family transcriptional regulator [bacterium]|nr:TetR/AcrR family transcriptional regulator [bacterium]